MFYLLIKINFLKQSRKVWYLDKNYAVNNIDFYLNVGEKEYLKHIILYLITILWIKGCKL